jgi:hypothetical protein
VREGEAVTRADRLREERADVLQQLDKMPFGQQAKLLSELALDLRAKIRAAATKPGEH